MEFTTNSLRNTTVAVDTDNLYFEIVTRFWHPDITKINKLDVESRQFTTIAEISQTPGGEPKVRFGDGHWLDSSEFIKYDPERAGGVFLGTEHVEYRWKSHKRRLQLVKANDEEKVPLVTFHPHRRHFYLFRMSQRAWLEIKPEATEALDKLIVSYLLVERRRRDSHMRLKLEIA
jgi:hypothetical protein